MLPCVSAKLHDTHKPILCKGAHLLDWLCGRGRPGAVLHGSSPHKHSRPPSTSG